MSYFDKNGNMRMHKDRPVENGILFRFYYESYYAYYNRGADPYEPEIPARHAITAATRYFAALIDGKFQANPPEDTEHFSRDNMYGLYGLCYMYNPEVLKDLPVFKWNNRKGTDKLTGWWHPNGWMVFLSLKSKFWAKVFALPIIGMISWSRGDWQDNPNDTSGYALWLSVIPLLNIQWGRGLLQTNCDMDTDFLADAPKVFDYYASMGGVWQNHDNPLRRLINANN